jgi:tetratricopeptide (TPR) repeat protein
MQSRTDPEVRSVLDALAQQVETGRVRGEGSIQFVRYMAENDLLSALVTIQDALNEAHPVDLYKEDLGVIDPRDGRTYLVYHIDRSQTRLDGFFERSLKEGLRSELVVMVTPDEVKALVDADAKGWKRRQGFHSWPRGKRRPMRQPGAANEPVTPEARIEVVRILEHEPERMDDGVKQRAFTLVLNLLRQGHREDARKTLMRLIAALKLQDDVLSLAAAYMLVGNVTFETNDYRQALEWYDQAQSYVEKTADQVKLSDLHHQRGYTRFLLGDYKASLEDFMKAARIDETLDDDFRRALIYRRLGVALDMAGREAQAEEYFKKALTLEETLKNDAGISRIYQHLGRLAEKKADFDGAAAYYDRSLEIKTRKQDTRGLASLYHQYGNMRFNQEKYAEALELYRKSLGIEEGLQDFQSIGRTMVQIGIVQEQLHRFHDASATLRKAHAVLARLNSPMAEKIAQMVKELDGKLAEDLDGVFSQAGEKDAFKGDR